MITVYSAWLHSNKGQTFHIGRITLTEKCGSVCVCVLTDFIWWGLLRRGKAALNSQYAICYIVRRCRVQMDGYRRLWKRGEMMTLLQRKTNNFPHFHFATRSSVEYLCLEVLRLNRKNLAQSALKKHWISPPWDSNGFLLIHGKLN